MGMVIEHEAHRQPHVGTIAGLVRASGVSRSALYTAIDGANHVSAATYARIEAGLGLPSDTLNAVGNHDLAELAELGVPTDLIEWVRRQLQRRDPNGARDYGG
jgi:hypothetical protein